MYLIDYSNMLSTYSHFYVIHIAYFLKYEVRYLFGKPRWKFYSEM